jgi:hypothetical protein
MLGTVEALPSCGIVEAKVRTAVDDQGFGAELFG